MQISEIGYHILQAEDDAFSQPMGFPQKCLLLTHSPMQLCIGSRHYDTQAGDLCILQKQTALHFSAAGAPLLYDWVLFDCAYDTDFYKALQIPENTLLRFCDTEFLCTLLRQLAGEYYAEKPRRSDMMDCLMKAVLIRISETAVGCTAVTPAVHTPHFAELVQLREKVYANPQEKWTVDMLCAEVNMSRSYFQSLYRETFGMTCIADVIVCKMNRARELLTSTDYTIAHIAQLCGYDNEEHFMRQFKKNIGVTPTTYRKNAARSM